MYIYRAVWANQKARQQPRSRDLNRIPLSSMGLSVHFVATQFGLRLEGVCLAFIHGSHASMCKRKLNG